MTDKKFLFSTFCFLRLRFSILGGLGNTLDLVFAMRFHVRLDVAGGKDPKKTSALWAPGNVYRASVLMDLFTLSSL